MYSVDSHTLVINARRMEKGFSHNVLSLNPLPSVSFLSVVGIKKKVGELFHCSVLMVPCFTDVELDSVTVNFSKL